MAIGLINNTILKPYSSSPSSSDDIQSLDISSNNDVLVPLTIFDKAAFDLHVAVLYAFKAPMPSNEVMKAALSKVLVYYPHLAGRFTTDGQGRTCIVLNNAGIRVTETYVPTSLAELLPFDPSKDVRHLLPPVEGNIEELLQIQLNRYACGGLVIGQTAHHRVCDGQSMSSFFVAWARTVRGLATDPLPYHDRLAVSQPRNPPKVDFDHRSIEFKKTTMNPDMAPVFSPSIETLIIHYSPEFVKKLKAKISEQSSAQNQRYSTFECLLSHTWKKVTEARGLDLEESTQVRVAVNGRARIKPSVPMEYFGNLVLWAYPKLKVKELLEHNHAYIAKAIHDEVTRVDNNYFKSFIDFGEIAKADGGEELEATAPEFGNSLCPDLEVDSWLRFQFHDLDFGGGGPCAFFPPNIPVEGLVIFLPTCSEDGGVDAVLSLLPEHVPLFKQISHSID
ncbi:hypothetical protein C5167_039298 [Papaver somniferum]|uniref:Uncharacterized protein n=1 Tax=Papaver somniferum TaxID=3469 RepID=A0A4Y7IFZ1_PAPSO|nr:tryptamine hydroxycinnamoyltransferase 2-like [Papaver somniferum]RZC46345.1 hypothetical protein C5167_039298 [Papaver somniferum]